jgi:L-alanine-DL-glutamate epimerase-like enolase superfamily enzyme
MKITAVESFNVEVPLSDEQQGVEGLYNRSGITRIRTDSGITGYGFSCVDADAVGALLLGTEPFSLGSHLEAGLAAHYGAENALWDIVGKAAGLPLHHLWGSHRERLLLYLTCVWPGAADQSDVTPQQQAEAIQRYAEAGYRAIKIRIWRPDPMADVETVRLVREMVGGRDKMEIMLDRTAEFAPQTWDYATALRVARALEDVDATWLEEPFARGDVEQSAQLRAETEIDITGGEHQPYSVYPGYVGGGAFDVVQPHCANVLRHLKSVADMAEAFGSRCIFHGSHGMSLIASLQVGATIASCDRQELVFTSPPMMPEDAWAPLNALVKSERLYTVRDGYIDVPNAPGLGVEVDEAAIDRYRVD